MHAKGKPQKRSPLKLKPLRNAGESVQSELNDLIDRELIYVVIAPIFLATFAAYEWYRAATSAPPQPWPLTVAAASATVFAVYRFLTLQSRAAALRLGRDGEKAVAQYLEAHRQPEWRIFNDIPADGFNVDHVIVAPQGVFVLETKTRSKPASGEAKVVYDGKGVLVDGHSPDRDPIAQARAIRDHVRDLLSETTGRRVAPRGVVVFPEWWVDQPPRSGPRPDIWVLNEKALPAFIEHEPIVLKPEDIALLADALRYRITRE